VASAMVRGSTEPTGSTTPTRKVEGSVTMRDFRLVSCLANPRYMRVSRRPDSQGVEEPRISGIFGRRATKRAGMHRRSHVTRIYEAGH